jgi:hypothetical protein
VQVPGVPEARPQPRRHREQGVVGLRAEELQAGVDIALPVDRRDRPTIPPRGPAVQLLDPDFLNRRAVGEQDAGEVGRGGCRVDRPGEAVPDELRQEARVIDMGVALEDGVDRVGLEGECR